MRYISAIEATCQAIADRIHYTHMVNQYNVFVWNGTPETCPEYQATPEEIQFIWQASKLFLDCTEAEAIVQYSLVGFRSDGRPVCSKTDPSILKGVTTAWAIPSVTVGVADYAILCPKKSNGQYYNKTELDSAYNLSEYTYILTDIE
jgi:hypothetical protein